MIYYHHTRSVMNSKSFILILKGATMMWFKIFPYGSNDSWKKSCHKFTVQFMVQKRKPKTIVILNNIQVKKKETQPKYINRFTKIVVEISIANNRLKGWIFGKGLRIVCMFCEKLGMKGDESRTDLLQEPNRTLTMKKNLLA